MTADDRRFEVLRAIVADYVATHEPVGSKSLVERHQLGVSPGHDPQRHGRAGGRGLHRAAAHLGRPDPHRQGLPPVRRPARRRSSRCPRGSGKAIQAFLSEAVDLDDVLRRSVRLLAQLTRQVAVVQYPTLSRSLGPARRGRSRWTSAGCCWSSSPTPAGSSSGWSSWTPTSPTRRLPTLRSLLATQRVRPAAGRRGVGA